MKKKYFVLLLLTPFLLALHADAEDCGTRSLVPGRSIVHLTESGERDLWDDSLAQKLSFCVSPVFRSQYEKIEEAVRWAAMEWMSNAHVNFQLVDDLSCDNTQRKTLFIILPSSRHANFMARAFFPSSPEVKRKIQINPRFKYESQRNLRKLMLHELGHVLGLRHEHTHPDAGGDCEEIEDFDPVTLYDPLSIMHYPTCGPQKLHNYVLSELDREGIGLLYPFP